MSCFCNDNPAENPAAQKDEKKNTGIHLRHTSLKRIYEISTPTHENTSKRLLLPPHQTASFGRLRDIFIVSIISLEH